MLQRFFLLPSLPSSRVLSDKPLLGIASLRDKRYHKHRNDWYRSWGRRKLRCR
jgi:hypothetical protein